MRLDTLFAGYYFAAVRDCVEGRPVPAAWNALFERRFSPDIDRIQFAVAGMNAHINHDLALALLDTSTALNLSPTSDSPEHNDYETVNRILAAVMPKALQMLAVDCLGKAAQDTGKIGRLLAFWDVCRARDLAWDFADHLRMLQGPARDIALLTQDAMTGALGRAILCAV